MKRSSFFIKEDDSPVKSNLKNLKVGDQVILKLKSVGTLVHDALTPAKQIWLFSTGTIITTLASLLCEPEIYERFDEVILTHTCRNLTDFKVWQGTYLGDQKRHFGG